MDGLTRRKFLIASGVAGGAALAAGSGTVTWSQLHKRAAATPAAIPAPGAASALVIVTLYGGNDGLNTLIPYTDPAYHAARPDLAYSESEVLPLGDGLGLNPGLTGMKALWQAKQLAVIRGVGYPQPDHSHFRSMDIWQTASPDEPVQTGWVGRWLDATGDDPIRAVNIGSVLPPLAVGAKSTAAALPLGKSVPLSPALASGLAGLGQASSQDSLAAAMVRTSYRSERTVASTFATVLDPTGSNAATAQPTGGQSSLKQQLDVVARCVSAGVPTQVYSVSLGGFDTHANEKDSQQSQLTQLDGAVSGFLSTMAADRRGRGVVVLVYSEFGRRVAANAAEGTDHGTAAPVFVAGVPVKGGFYGSQPSLTDLDAGDLKASTDFRVVYGELTAKVLKTDPAKVLGTQRPDLGFLT